MAVWEHTEIVQIMPCEPGMWWSIVADSESYELHRYPVVAWALVRYENYDGGQRLDDPTVSFMEGLVPADAGIDRAETWSDFLGYFRGAEDDDPQTDELIAEMAQGHFEVRDRKLRKQREEQ